MCHSSLIFGVRIKLVAKCIFCVVFQERFLGLYLGGMRILHQEVTRVTLFAPARARSGTMLGVLPLLLCGCLTRPFFLLRTSTYWCVCVKHLIPVVMAASLSGCKSFHAV